ncbi:MAG: hypothetical protein ACPGED_10195, partial [Flavobacteriales bacterium]
MKSLLYTCFFAFVFVLVSCGDTGSNGNNENSNDRSEAMKNKIAQMKLAKDHHSFSEPNKAVATHLSWDAEVDFDTKVISGTATFTIDNKSKGNKVVFDIRELEIEKVTLDGGQATEFAIGPETEFLGQALEITINPSTTTVAITYKSSPDAGALLW